MKATYGTGVFVLAHAGDERPEPERRSPADGCLAGRRRVEWALDGGVFTAGAVLEWLTGELGLADDPASLAAAAADAGSADGVRVLPALAGIGAPWWRPDAHAVIAGLGSGSGPPRSDLRRSRGSRGGSPTCSPQCGSRSRSRSCVSTAG